MKFAHYVEYTIRALDGVEYRAFQAVNSAVNLTFLKLQLPGHLFITMVPGDHLRTGDGDDQCGFAVYQEGARQILIAGLKPEGMDPPISDQEWLEELMVSIVHEVIHYKQELDGTLIGSPENEEEAERLAYEVLEIKRPPRT